MLNLRLSPRKSAANHSRDLPSLSTTPRELPARGPRFVGLLTFSERRTLAYGDIKSRENSIGGFERSLLDRIL